MGPELFPGIYTAEYIGGLTREVPSSLPGCTNDIHTFLHRLGRFVLLPAGRWIWIVVRVGACMNDYPYPPAQAS